MAALPSQQAACNATTKAVRQLIDDLDDFVGSHQLWLLGNWTVSSRAGAGDKADADNLEYGARNLLTLWGGDEGSDLAGYDGPNNRPTPGFCTLVSIQRLRLVFLKPCLLNRSWH
eukprot:COSAG04_NODE_1642_length_6070_cov_9.329928_11_plen_115_part_00